MMLVKHNHNDLQFCANVDYNKIVRYSNKLTVLTWLTSVQNLFLHYFKSSQHSSVKLYLFLFILFFISLFLFRMYMHLNFTTDFNLFLSDSNKYIELKIEVCKKKEIVVVIYFLLLNTFWEAPNLLTFFAKIKRNKNFFKKSFLSMSVEHCR